MPVHTIAKPPGILPFLVLVLGLTLSGCSADSDRELKRTSEKVMEINGSLMTAIEGKNWSEVEAAQKTLDRLDSRLQSIIDGNDEGGSYDSVR